jgi:uncharacterized protein (TIGR02996 family)
MPTTLEALHRAVVASPEDRTVRLAYADALDEAGDAAAVARAEFIRAQIAAEAVPAADATHPIRLRARRLFEGHWLEWWRPVAAAAGLPAPHVPSRRLRDRIARRVRSAVQENPRPANWPYAVDPGATAVHAADLGVSVRFGGGFPEEVRFTGPPAAGPEPEWHHLGDAMPLARLAFAHMVTPAQWDRVDGLHLANLPELAFDNLLPDTTMLVAGSPHLAALQRLTADPLATTLETGNADTVRFLVQSPVWAGLRVLRLTGRLGPPALRDLAAGCTLERLEELDVRIGTPGVPGGAVFEALNEVLRRFMQTLALQGTEPVRWTEYGPPLAALAAAPWVRNLRRLSITSGYLSGLLGVLSERLYGSAERGADLIPDGPVRALADAVDTPVLERLTLPGTLLGPSVREDLTTRLGPRVVFA